MNFLILFQTARKFSLLPLLIYSVYLTILYANDFWMKMIGTTHFAFALILLISTTLSLFFAIRTYDEGKPHLNNKQLYFFLTYFSFFISISIIYYTRDIKKSECIYWINEFMQTNNETFYINCFNQIYDSQSTVDSFVHSRITDVHDVLICIVVINLSIFIVFTFLFKRIVRFYQAKKNINLYKKSDEGSLIPSGPNEKNHDISLDDNNENEPIPENEQPQSPQRNSQSSPQPSPQINHKSPQPSPVPNQKPPENPQEYEYEYVYSDES